MLDKWQPIESAPKDGTWLLLLDGRADEDGLRHYVARWGPFREWEGPYADGYPCSLTDIGTAALTHWMPLPDPPPDSSD